MSRWLSIKNQARQFHEKISDRIDGFLSAQALISAAEEKTGIKCTPLEPNDLLLDGADAVLQTDLKRIWYRNDLPQDLRFYYLAHEFAHDQLHSSGHVLNSENILFTSIDPDSAFGTQQIQAYSPRERKEREANVFAREFLLPSYKLRSHYKSGMKAEDIANRTGLPLALVHRQLTYALLQTEENANKSQTTTWILNQYQKQAAETENCPFLLNAGPGTGKTKTLVGRILYLLNQKHISPQAILALTFSNRAAEEMRERVAEYAPEAANEIWIGTFHAFGLEFLQKFGAALDLPSQINVLDPVTSSLLLADQLPELKLEYYLDLYDPVRNLGEIVQAISRAKDELVTPEKYLNLAEMMLQEAESDKEELEALKALEVARIYEYYQNHLQENKLLDFGDLITKAINLLQSDETLRTQVHTQYSHILVDEYQDVNFASVRLLRELAGFGEGLWVVGDRQQSIYRFRGATPNNVSQFTNDYSAATVKSLKINYRSEPSVVKAFSSFSSEMVAYNSALLSGSLIPNRPKSSSEVQLCLMENQLDELDFIADKIEQFTHKGIPFYEQAILCRTHKQLADVAEVLEEKNIPIHYLSNVLEREEIRDLLSLLSLLSQPDGRGLIRVSQFEDYKIPIEDVAILYKMMQESNLNLLFVLTQIDQLLISEQGKSGLSKLRGHLKILELKTSVWSILTSYLFDISRYLDDVLYPETFSTSQESLAIFKLLQMADLFSGQTIGGANETVNSFLRYLRHLGMVGGGQLQQMLDTDSSINAVRLLTVHAAKGLEFDVVYIPFLGRGKFPKTKQRKNCPPPKGMLPEQSQDWHLEEEECLLFVALSRAKDELILTRSSKYGNRNSNPSQFWEILNKEIVVTEITGRTLMDDVSIELSELEETPAQNKIIVTSGRLDSIRRCARQDYYSNELNFGSNIEPNPYQALMRCVFKTFAYLGQTFSEFEKILTDTEVIDFFEGLWHHHASLSHSTYYKNKGLIMVRNGANYIRNSSGTLLFPTWNITHNKNSIMISPDLIEIEKVDSTVQTTVTRFRPKTPSSAETSKAFYALSQNVANELFPEADVNYQILNLRDGAIHDAQLGSRKLKSQLGRIDLSISLLKKRDFKPSPDKFKCPRCPYFFICPADSVIS